MACTSLGVNTKIVIGSILLYFRAHSEDIPDVLLFPDSFTGTTFILHRALIWHFRDRFVQSSVYCHRSTQLNIGVGNQEFGNYSPLKYQLIYLYDSSNAG